MNTDPDKDKEDKESSNNILGSLSMRRATLWNDFTSKIRSGDKTTPDDGSDVAASTASPPATTLTPPPGKSFMESVREKLQSVKLYENGDAADDCHEANNVDATENGKSESEPLISTSLTGPGQTFSDGDSDIATCGESETGEAAITDSGATEEMKCRRKRLGKRQDSFTAEEVYLDTVAAQVRCGLVKPDPHTKLVSPSRAVQEFVFADEAKSTEGSRAESRTANGVCSDNTLRVANGNLINFDSVHNLSQAASSVAETVVHHEDDGVFDYESSG